MTLRTRCTFARQIVRAETDPILRDVRGRLDAIKASTPGWSDTVPPRINVWGEPILLDRGLGPDLISPLYSARLVEDFSSEEAARLRAKLTKPQRKLMGVQLTPREFVRLQILVGQGGKKRVDLLTSAPYYQRLPDGLRRKLMEEAYADARDAGRKMLALQLMQENSQRFLDVKRQELKELFR